VLALAVGTVLASAHPALATPSAADLDRRIDAASRQLEVVVERYDQTRGDLHDTAAREVTVGRDLAPLQADLDHRQRILGGMAADLYREEVRGPSLALISAPTPSDFVDQLLLVHRVNTEQVRATADLRSAQARVDLARRTLAALATQQRDQQARLAATKAAIEQRIASLKALRISTYGTGSRYGSDDLRPPPPYVPGPAGLAVGFAFEQLGKPYVWGAGGPDAYDCSGLTSAAWARAGVTLPHNAREQYAAVAHVSRADLRPGDLVFYYGGISHVALYIGNGLMIHAPAYGEHVRVERIDFQPIHGYGRPT
jgi:peptidoglycan DL-endopeptidase CwlO